MKNKPKAVLMGTLVLLLVVVAALAGCVRSYSQPPTQIAAPKEAEATGAVEPGGVTAPEGSVPEGSVSEEGNLPPSEATLAPGEPGGVTAPEGSAPEGSVPGEGNLPPSEATLAPGEPGGVTAPEGSAPEGGSPPSEPTLVPVVPVMPEATQGAPAQPESTLALPVIQSPGTGAGSGGAPAAVAPSLVLPAEYKLQKGEFPYCIARRYNVDQFQLLRINGLNYGMLFKPGLVLKMPQTGDPWVGTRALRPHPAQYTVRSGDTLAGIACYFGDVDPAAVAASNGLDPNIKLQAGQVLQIP